MNQADALSVLVMEYIFLRPSGYKVGLSKCLPWQSHLRASCLVLSRWNYSIGCFFLIELLLSGTQLFFFFFLITQKTVVKYKCGFNSVSRSLLKICLAKH